MQKVIKHTIYTFLAIFAATACVVLGALIYLWVKDAQDLPYLKWLITSVIAEVIGVVVLIVKKGLKYLPEVEISKKESETLEFMKRFINSGSSVTIVTNRLAWLRKSAPIQDAIIKMANDGTLLEIITPSEVADDIKKPLADAGVIFYVTKETVPPDARFTLVDGHRSGAEKLAIARGSHPEYEITIFDNNSAPQIIAMAKDIIRKSKELSSVA